MNPLENRHDERYVGDRDMEHLEAENAPLDVPITSGFGGGYEPLI